MANSLILARDNRSCSKSIVAFAVWHVAPFEPKKKIVYHRSVVFTIISDGLTNVLFKNLRTNDAPDPKSESTSNLLNLTWVGVVLYTKIVLINKAFNPKTHLIAKDDFFAKTWILFETLQRPVNDQMALSMVINFEYLDKYDLILVQAQVSTQNTPNRSPWNVESCARQGIDCLWCSCTHSRTVTMFSNNLEFFWRMVVGWLFSLTENLQYGHHNLESGIGRTCWSIM